MTQQKIRYDTIMALGFTEQVDHDQQFINEYGFDYTIIELKLCRGIYVDWAKETQLAEIVRLNKDKKIVARLPIRDLEHLQEWITFFKTDTK